MADRAAHDDAVREQFRIQARTFTDPGFAAAGLDWIVAELSPSGADVVLDVAAGAAHLGRALAPHVTHVSALDLTPEMLEQGSGLADSAGLRNITFLLGDAVRLPWLDGQFDLTVCRLTLHQVADPAAVVREMVRVTRPTGRVAIIDMTAAEDPAVAAETNRIERLRDPSHGRTLTVAEIHRLLVAAGGRVASTSRHDQPVDVEDWLERTATPAAAREEVRTRFDDELRGGAPTGLHPHRRDGVLLLTHPWVMTVGRPG
ncbi:MAG: methyltransferase domain-containing protein [Actinophytocola sp.]|uniref:class I SAM-dependent methyltransferase n=1 Tax=Actinophytocola sp. TaxID=1872138 RepID=UPI0013266832|nr:methyltransferase domain-containing protein [Actinophytocola sp.]MPZ85454.1 methyltransferase domain-containing protein [Actinophytocola sp.]